MKGHDTPQLSIIDQLKQRKTYMPTSEVMDLFGVARGTLCGWVRSGTIPAVRIGKDNKFDPADVVRYISTRRT